jgi:hypothetical protein
MIRALRADSFWIVPVDDMVGQQPHAFHVPATGEELKGAHTYVTGGDTSQDCALKHCFPNHHFPGRHCGKRASRGNAKRRHRLADHVLAQDWTQRGSPITAARVWRPTGAFELNIAPYTGAVNQLAKKNRAAIPELRHKHTELVTRIRGGDGLSPFGNAIARQHLHTLPACEQLGVQAKLGGQRLVNPNEPRGSNLCGRETREEPLGQPRVCIVEWKRI